MTYRSLERANAYFYDPVRRPAVMKRHGGIAYLSSGVNHLKAPDVLLDIAGRELKERRLIENYTSPGGALGVAAAISFELHERLGRTSFDTIGPANVCLTVGATGALAGAFRYLAAVAGARSALVLGLNYSFFSTICDEVGIAYRTVCSQEPGRLLPSAAEACDMIFRQRPAIVVLSQPTNPSGELYDEADLRRVVETADAHGCWLVFDEVPSLASPAEEDLPAPIVGGTENFPPRLIWINSFSKSRSLAGLRVGYMAATAPIVDYVRKANERLLWSPVNAGSSALIADMVLRAICRRTKGVAAADTSRTIAETVRRAGRYLRVFAPYSDDFARLEGIWDFIDGATDWSAAHASYRADLDDVARTCRSNWRTFSERMAPYVRQAIALQSGFNHCVKLDTRLSEWDFVTTAFDAAGVDFYTESVFSDHDDATSPDFWLRVSCAVERETFTHGTERLAALLAHGSHSH
ncbi:MAG: pyridoxal phosphate-dependent aminotransferase [Pseudolabrys sp.]